jgi:S-adenosylmethionine synthetase
VENPKIAVEVLLGHGVANIIIESSVDISQTETEAIVSRITKREDLKVSLVMVAQDPISSPTIKTTKSVAVTMAFSRACH